MGLVSMNIKREPRDGEAAPSGDYDRRPCIYLDDDQCEALGFSANNLPKPGTVMSAEVRLVVSAVSARQEMPGEGESLDKPDVTLTLCVDAIGFTDTGKSAAATLYGS